jgi:RES domain-containing protein
LTPQRLDRVLTAYRIGDPHGVHPIYDATGSKLYPGRWNTALAPVIYASEHYSTALLEKLAHGAGRLPPNQHWIEITIPNGTTYEWPDIARLPGWDSATMDVSRAFGERWQQEMRSAILIVPSVVARRDHNVLINPDHPDAAAIRHSLPRPVHWDSRLFEP